MSLKGPKKTNKWLNRKAIEAERARILKALEKETPGTPEYELKLRQLELLTKMVPKAEKKAIDINIIIQCLVTFGLACLVFFEEQIKNNIIRSKLFGWISHKY